MSEKKVVAVEKRTYNDNKDRKSPLSTIAKVLLIVFVGIPLLVIIIALFVGMSSSSNTSTNNTTQSTTNTTTTNNYDISKENYNKITVGMTKAEVFAILGSNASVSESETPGVGKMEMYNYQDVWAGKG